MKIGDLIQLEETKGFQLIISIHRDEYDGSDVAVFLNESGEIKTRAIMMLGNSPALGFRKVKILQEKIC